jgi:glucose/mannose-6-phosphate isomerase
MEEQLKHFPKEFEWEPVLLNASAKAADAPIILCSMGGSHLGGRLLATDPNCPPLYIHSDYGLPEIPEAWEKDALFIASSYSGNTEETIDSAHAALKQGDKLAFITSGGVLAEFAREHNLPTILLPKEDIEPRVGVGYAMIALAHLVDKPELVEAVRTAGRSLSYEAARDAGNLLAEAIGTRVPAFYASNRNTALAYYLKAAINETGKIPATYNVIPELCHNELSGYESGSEALLPVFLEDSSDTPRVQTRMTLMRSMLTEHTIPNVSFPLMGDTALSKGLHAVLTGNYAGVMLAKERGVPDADTPFVREFKKRLASS